MKNLFILGICFAIASCGADNSTSPSTGNTTKTGGESGISTMDASGGNGTGVSGSMARMTSSTTHLYVATSNSLFTFSLENLDEPKLVSEQAIDNFVETIFQYDGKLFLGTRSGMLIYTLTNPDKPEYRSTFTHVFSCDPVVVSNPYAYSTLRQGTECDRGVNRLDVIDVSNIDQPYLVNSYDLSNPRGLGIYGDHLYVCDNNRILHFSLLNGMPQDVDNSYELDGAYDLIPYNGVLIAVASSGIHQYRMENDGSLTLLSKILTQ